MPSKKTRKDCPICGAASAMVLEPRDVPITYKTHQRSHVTTTWWCTNCDDGILEPDMLEARERAFVELRAEVDNVLLPEQVAAIRKKLGLSQREAGRILGGGVRAFQKYESGETPVSEPMKNLLTLLGNRPERLRELQPRSSIIRAGKLRADAAEEVRAASTRRIRERARPSAPAHARVPN